MSVSAHLAPQLVSAGELQSLALGWPYLPYSHAPGAAPAMRAQYLIESLLRAQAKGAFTLAAGENGNTQAVVQLEELAWDTELLRRHAARIAAWLAEPGAAGAKAREQALRAALDHARRAGVQYLLARVAGADVEGAHLLERHRFRLIDGLLTFGTSCTNHSHEVLSPADGLRCSAFCAGDLPALEEIAASSFSIDRFHSDPAIGKQTADAVHRRWIRDSCAGFADCVLVARGESPVGFTTLKLDRLAEKFFGAAVGIVVLVATSAEQRRRGVAQALTRASLEWFRAQGCAWVEVGTQLANIRASRVYQAAGFRLVGSSLTFRRLLGVNEEET